MENTNWVAEEQKGLDTAKTYEERPSLKMEENKITELVIDISKKFETWTGANQDGTPVVKAILPVIHGGVAKHWWINKKNPIYFQILEKAAKATGTPSITLKFIRTGQAKATKYAIVE